MRAPEPLPPAIAADLEAMDAAVAGRPHTGGDAVLAELAVLLRDTRPAPDEDAARRLDARAAKALRPPAGTARRRPTWLMPALGACASVALVIVAIAVLHGSGSRVGVGSGGVGAESGGGGSVAGGAQSSGSSGSTTAAPDSARAPNNRAGAGSKGGGAASGQAAIPPNGSATAAAGRAVQFSVFMRLGARPERIDDVATGVARVATDLGGYVASSNVTSRQGADLDLRVPSGRLDQAVARLSQLTHVRQLQRSTFDITDQLTAARENLQETRAARRSLLRQLRAATTAREENLIRRRLAVATRGLHEARAQVLRVRAQASYASIGVTVVLERHRAGAAPTGGWTPGDALHDAGRVLEVAAGVALIALAVALPLGLIGVPAWVVVQRLTRRRREHALDFA